MFPLLAIETSCDETAAAVIDPETQILANVVRSQVPEHRFYGGVVPEVASRRHVEWIGPVVDEHARAGHSGRAGSIAATRGPGLVGCLLVGLSYAQGPAAPWTCPSGVNHMEGHLLALFVGEPEPPFPFLALVVSAATRFIHALRREYELQVDADDAAGEAFDKGARLLGLPYPGGVEIDKLASSETPAIDLPGPCRGSRDDLSFGLKTALRRYRPKRMPDGQAMKDVCALCRRPSSIRCF